MDDLKKMALKSMLGKKKVREDEKEEEAPQNQPEEKQSTSTTVAENKLIRNIILPLFKDKVVKKSENQIDPNIHLKNESNLTPVNEIKNIPDNSIIIETNKENTISSNIDNIPSVENQPLKDKIDIPSFNELIKSPPVEVKPQQATVPISPIHKKEQEPMRTMSPVISPIDTNKINEDKCEPENIESKGTLSKMTPLIGSTSSSIKKEEKKTIVSFTQAKKNIEEFCTKIERLDIELKEKMSHKLLDVNYEDYISDFYKVKLIEEFFDKRCIPKDT